MKQLFACPDYQALLAAVRMVPEDDTSRLVLADWLQEQGEETLAEFIRVQVELAALSPPVRTRSNGTLEWSRPLSGGEPLMGITVRGVPRILMGATVDVEHPTSRVSADTFLDYVVVGGVVDLEGTARIVLTKGESWPHRERYNALLLRQHRLLCFKEGDEPVPWEEWCYAPHRDEEGVPSEVDCRGGLRVYPAMWDQFPWVEVPPRIRQTFRRGFVERVTTAQSDWLRYGPAMVRHPFSCVAHVELEGRRPRDRGDEERAWGWKVGTQNDSDPSGVVPEILQYGLWNERARLGHRCVDFSTAQLACEALSTACLAYAWEDGA